MYGHGMTSKPQRPTRDEVRLALAGAEETLRRRLLFVALLSKAFKAEGWPPPVVVGGHAVEFYSAGGYATADIDLVCPSEPLDAILPGWGFVRSGRHWLNEELALVVEAPAAFLGPGQRERATLIRVAEGEVLVLSLEDLVIDRLNACVHWASEEDCGWARVLLAAHAGRFDQDYLLGRAVDEQVAEELKRALLPSDVDQPDDLEEAP